MQIAKYKTDTLIENRYRVLDTIGSGGMGTVYRVADEAADDKVLALKTLHLLAQGNYRCDLENRFQEEFRLLTQLQHPHLVRVYDYGITAQDVLYYTMEWMAGPSLASRQSPVEPSLTVTVMVQVCRALAYLHTRGMIHGDLKPHNVMLTTAIQRQTPHVKLVDFGLAQEMREVGIRSRYYTRDYAAPEVREGHFLDQRSDLYSLGALWYVLLTGGPPDFMEGPGKERLVRYTLQETLRGFPDAPVALSEIVARLLATKPDARFESANAVLGAVNEITESSYRLETRETAGSYALRTHFVERETELAALGNAWRKAQTETKQLVVIDGEAGAGKTRLVEELKVRVELGGGRVVWGQCVEQGGSAYQPWREILRVLFRYVEAAENVDLDLQRVGAIATQILPELREREYLQGIAPPAPLDSQAAQQRLNYALAQVVMAAAALRPTLVVIESAQWADEATLALLQHLTRLPGGQGLMVIVTYRSNEVRSNHMLATLSRRNMMRLSLKRLSPTVTQKLACTMLGLKSLPDSLAQRLYQTTGGNAFFVQELIRFLAVDAAVLQRTRQGWRVDEKALQTTTLPASIQQVVERRLRQLSPETLDILQWAAVAGTVFWQTMVADIGEISSERVRSGLAEAIQQTLVAVRDETAFAGESEYLFDHPTVREVTYRSISPEKRRRYHERAASWLETRAPLEIEAHLGLIAEHYVEAEKTELALKYLLQAGKQAADQYANAEAIAYFSRALALADPEDVQQRYTLLLAREDVYHRIGRRAAQADELEALTTLMPQLAPSQRIEILLHRARYHHYISEYPIAIDAAEKAVSQAAGTQAVQAMAKAHRQLGACLQYQGMYDQAIAHYTQAHSLAKQCEAHAVMAGSLRGLGIVAAKLGNYKEASVYHRQALNIYRAVDDLIGEGSCLNSLGVVSYYQQDYTQAHDYYEQNLTIFQRIGDRHAESITLSNLGLISHELGDVSTAKSYYLQGLEIARDVGEQESATLCLDNLGAASYDLGEYTQAHTYFTQALEIAQQIGNQDMEAALQNEMGALYLAQGQLETSKYAFQQAERLHRHLNQPQFLVEDQAGLALVTLEQGDLNTALELIAPVSTYLKNNPALEGSDYPLRTLAFSCKVLHAGRMPSAPSIIAQAYALLRRHVKRIEEPEHRMRFLNSMPTQTIMSLWQGLQPGVSALQDSATRVSS